MKSLVIHPVDRSTDFLKPIYANLRNKTVITNEADLAKLKSIKEHFQLAEWTGYSSDDPPDDEDIDWGRNWYSGKSGEWVPSSNSSYDPDDDDDGIEGDEKIFNGQVYVMRKGVWVKRSVDDAERARTRGKGVDDEDSPYLPAGATHPPKREDFDNDAAWQNYWKDRFERMRKKYKDSGAKSSYGSSASGHYGQSYKKWVPPARDLATIVPAKNEFDRFVMMGHGSSWGLFSTAHSGMLINDNTARLLTPCSQNIFIWCNADQYVRGNKLRGFFTGMFISEVGESKAMGLKDITQAQVDESNNTFAALVGRHINDNVKSLHTQVKRKYAILAETNPVAAYNCDRLYIL